MSDTGIKIEINGGEKMKNVNKTIALNIGSMMLLQGIAFFTTPIFTRILGAEQYGIYSVFYSWVVILSCVLGVGMGTTLSTGRYQFRKEYYEFRSSILLFGSLISALIIAIGIILIRPISDILGYSVFVTGLIYIMAFAQYIINFAQNAFVYEKQADKNFFLSVSLSFSTVALSLCLIPHFTNANKVFGRIYGALIPTVVIAILIWFMLYSKKPSGLHKKYCKYGLVVGVPVVFHTLAQNILTQSDRVMMQHMNVSDVEIGIYSLFYTLVSVLGVVLNSLNTSWCPFYYDDIDLNKWRELEDKCKNYIELFSILTIGFLMLSREVSYVLGGSEYRSGISVVPILVLGVYFTFMYQFPVNFEFFHKKTQIIAMGTILAAVVNIILNIVFIPSWGMYGAAAATAISYGILFILHFFIVTHMKECPYHLKAVKFIPGLLSVLVGIILFYILCDYWYFRWGIGLLLGCYELRRILKRKRVF